MSDGWTSKPNYKPSTQCRHREVAFQTKNISFLTDNIHYLELFGFCTQCEKHVTFVGIPSGEIHHAPSMTSDGMLVRLPFVCEGDVLKI